MSKRIILVLSFLILWTVRVFGTDAFLSFGQRIFKGFGEAIAAAGGGFILGIFLLNLFLFFYYMKKPGNLKFTMEDRAILGIWIWIIISLLFRIF